MADLEKRLSELELEVKRIAGLIDFIPNESLGDEQYLPIINQLSELTTAQIRLKFG